MKKILIVFFLMLLLMSCSKRNEEEKRCLNVTKSNDYKEVVNTDTPLKGEWDFKLKTVWLVDSVKDNPLGSSLEVHDLSNILLLGIGVIDFLSFEMSHC